MYTKVSIWDTRTYKFMVDTATIEILRTWRILLLKDPKILYKNDLNRVTEQVSGTVAGLTLATSVIWPPCFPFTLTLLRYTYREYMSILGNQIETSRFKCYRHP